MYNITAWFVTGERGKWHYDITYFKIYVMKDGMYVERNTKT